MKRIAVLAIGVGLAGTACGGRGAVSLGPAPAGAARAASPSASPTPQPPSPKAAKGPSPQPSPSTPQPAAGHVSVQVWFDRNGKLLITSRTGASTPAVAHLAMTELLAGPSPAERTAGVSTVIPASTRLLDVGISGGTATVDLSGAFESGASSATMNMRIAQVVFTLTQFSTVRNVRFAIDGQPRTTVGGEPVQQSQTRAMFDSLLPPILVERPVPGATVSSPVTVSGTADVFEATVTVRILDANGKEIARTFTTASCGTGCRGTFSVDVTYRLSHGQSGTIQVLDYSAKDGSPENVQDVPVTLAG